LATATTSTTGTSSTTSSPKPSSATGTLKATDARDDIVAATGFDFGAGIDFDADTAVTTGAADTTVTTGTTPAAVAAVAAIATNTTSSQSPKHKCGIAASTASAANTTVAAVATSAAIASDGAIATIAADARDGVVIEEKEQLRPRDQRATGQVNTGGPSGACSTILTSPTSLAISAKTSSFAGFAGLPNKLALGSKESNGEGPFCAIGTSSAICPVRTREKAETSEAGVARGAAIAAAIACSFEAVFA
jgi:hypothetical protein